MPTASSVELALTCPPSHVLPGYDSTNEAARRGTAIHEYLRRAPELGRREALALVPEQWRDICDAIDLSQIPPNVSREVTVAWDTHAWTGRELGRDLGRDYSMRRPSEIVGTADIIGISDDGTTVYVGDYKTGRTEQPPPAHHPQLLTLALAAAAHMRADFAIVEVIRIDEDGEVWRETSSLDRLDLDRFAARLAVMMASLTQSLRHRRDGSALPLVEGKHCRYCPAFAHCPAKASLAMRIGTGQEAEDYRRIQITRENAAKIWHRVALAKELLSKVEGVIRTLARQAPIDLGDGTQLGELLSPGNESLDGDTAHDVITLMRGQACADAAVTRLVSKAGIRRALRDDLKPGERLGRTLDEIVEAVRDAGGARRTPKKRVVVYPLPF